MLFAKENKVLSVGIIRRQIQLSKFCKVTSLLLLTIQKKNLENPSQNCICSCKPGPAHCFSNLNLHMKRWGSIEMQILTQQVWEGLRWSISNKLPGDALAAPLRNTTAVARDQAILKVPPRCQQ